MSSRTNRKPNGYDSAFQFSTSSIQTARGFDVVVIAFFICDYRHIYGVSFGNPIIYVAIRSDPEYA